jgi:hypothetical protein
MGSSGISRLLDCLRSLVFNGDSGGTKNAPCDATCENFMGGGGVGGGIDALSCCPKPFTGIEEHCLGEVYEDRSRLSKSDGKLIMD